MKILPLVGLVGILGGCSFESVERQNELCNIYLISVKEKAFFYDDKKAMDAANKINCDSNNLDAAKEEKDKAWDLVRYSSSNYCDENEKRVLMSNINPKLKARLFTDYCTSRNVDAYKRGLLLREILKDPRSY